MDVSLVIFLKLLYVTLTIFLTTFAQDFNLGLCSDPRCLVAVGDGHTLQTYHAAEEHKLSFTANEKVQIYVKDAGPKRDLLGVMIGGKRGYVSKGFIREDKIYTSTKSLIPAQFDFVYSSSVDNSGRQNYNNIPVSASYLENSGNNQHFQHHTYNPSFTDASHFDERHSNFKPQIGGETAQSVAENPVNVDQYTNFEPMGYYDYSSSYLDPSYYVDSIAQTVWSEGHSPSQSHPHNIRNQISEMKNAPLESSFSSRQHGHSVDNFQNSHYSDSYAGNPDYGFPSIHVPNVQQDTASGMQNIHITDSQSHAAFFNQEAQPSIYPSGVESNSIQSPAPRRTMNANANEAINQDMWNTMALLKEQGVSDDVIAKQDFPESQNAQDNQNPSQNIHIVETSSISSSQNEYSLTQGSSISSQHPNLNFQDNTFESKNPAQSILEIANETEKVGSEGKVDEKITRDHNIDYEDDEVEIEEVDNIISASIETNIKRDSDAAFHFDEFPKDEKSSLQSDKDNVESKKNHTEEKVIPKSQIPNIDVQESSSNSQVPHNQFNNDDHTPKTSKDLPLLNEEAEFSKPNTDSSVNNFEGENHVHSIVDNLETNSEIHSSALDSSFITQTLTELVTTESPNSIANNSISENIDIAEDIFDIWSNTTEYATKVIEFSKSSHSSHNSLEETLDIDNANETESLSDKDQEIELDKILNISELSEAEKVGYLNPYQIRNLMEENGAKENENVESDEIAEENSAYLEFDINSSLENNLEAIRLFIELLISWVPEPFYSIIMDLHSRGISPRVPVFTVISSIPCIFLIIVIVYIREKSKEKQLTVQLALSEKNVYMLSAEKNILEEKLEKATVELQVSNSSLTEERSTFEELQADIKSLKQQIEKRNLELDRNIEEIEALKEREKQYVELVSDHEKAHLELMEDKHEVEQKMLEVEDTISNLTTQLQDKEKEFDELHKEKLDYTRLSEDYEEKINQLQLNCNQLLTEAEVWNMRVNDLSLKLSEETSAKEQLENSFKLKESEIESLTYLVETFKSFEELQEGDENESKSNKEKLQSLMNSASILIKLQNQEKENEMLSNKLMAEKNKILEMEVELLDAKSENDKLKLSYNQALQDKAEAQTKLDVLTSYFKDKEIQLQKQLGAQEAVREKKEKDADSAERRICLIEQENASYKYQVASMKQEMEETERNLKSQIASQEKKAHENWIAARSAERKLEDMKQEVMQLRQRLTLLEREQEKWVNSSRDEIIRPVPKRISGLNEDSINSQDMNNSIDLPHMFPPPHMMLPPDRPLPPLPPPPHLPPFLPPPPLEPHFRSQPWPPMPPPDSISGSEFRMTPPEFNRGRESTPPRGHHSTMIDGDMGPRQSSPLGGEMKDSRNSTPPHSLPDFHDIPPPPRPFFHAPGIHHRYPLPPPFRREMHQGPRRTEYVDNGSSSRATQQSSLLPENWPHTNSRV